MIITNSKKFKKIIKILRKFNKWDKKVFNKKKPFHEIIYYSENKLYSTEGHILAIIDISDCVSIIDVDSDFVFPNDVMPKKSIEIDIDNKLIVDGERIDFKQFETKFYKRIIPTQNPNAELEFDFSAYKSLDIGYDRKSAEIEFSKENAFFKYCDDCETTRVIDDCFSKELLNDNYGDFQEVRFPMWEIFEIMKISKKFKIQQFGKIDAMHKIIADDYEFLIMPKRWLLSIWLKRR